MRSTWARRWSRGARSGRGSVRSRGASRSPQRRASPRGRGGRRGPGAGRRQRQGSLRERRTRKADPATSTLRRAPRARATEGKITRTSARRSRASSSGPTSALATTRRAGPAGAVGRSREVERRALSPRERRCQGGHLEVRDKGDDRLALCDIRDDRAAADTRAGQNIVKNTTPPCACLVVNGRERPQAPSTMRSRGRRELR